MNLLAALAIFAVVALVVVFGAVVVPDTYRDLRDAFRRAERRRVTQAQLNAAVSAFAVAVGEMTPAFVKLAEASTAAAKAVTQLTQAWMDWFEAQTPETQEMICQLAEQAEATEMP